MGKLEKYLLIAIAMAALIILSNMNRGNGKTGACCPFLIKQSTNPEKVNE